MKKIGLILVIAIVLLSGCTQSGPDTPAHDQNTPNDETNPIDSPDELALDEVIIDGPVPPISEWCIEGYTYDVSTPEASTSAVIEGIATYKGDEFCKGLSSTQVSGIDVETTYYFKYQAQEMWVISTVAGHTTETHIIDQEIVE